MSTRPEVSDALAAVLVSLGRAVNEAQPGKAYEIARARLEGACGVLDALDYTFTPVSASMAIMDALRAIEPAPAPHSHERRDWFERAKKEVIVHLANAI